MIQWSRKPANLSIECPELLCRRYWRYDSHRLTLADMSVPMNVEQEATGRLEFLWIDVRRLVAAVRRQNP